MKTALVAAASALALTGLAAGAAQAQDWRALAEQDLRAAHAALRDNHPAMVIDDQASAHFRHWLDAGLAEALADLSRVNSSNSYAALLRGYGNGFRDANISLEPTWVERDPWYAVAWPSFTTAWRDGHYVVSWVKPDVRNLPRVGWRLDSCDGVPAEEIAQRRLDRYEGDLTQEANRIATAPYLFWGRGNPFAGSQPGECRFMDGNRRRNIRLVGEFVQPEERLAAYRASVYTPPETPLAVETVNNLAWIHIHDLADEADWDAFLAQVASQQDAIRSAPGVVIDLRGASGSSPLAASYILRTATRIWSPEWIGAHQASGAQIAYRATPDNREWFAQTLGRMRGDAVFATLNPGTIIETEQVVLAFDQAIEAGQQSFTRPVPAAAPIETGPNPVAGNVIVLIDGGCSIGCLDAVDVLKALPNVRLAGAASDADSIFVEPTVLYLPSNYGRLSYGHKAWINRARGTNEPHQPAPGLAYAGNPADEHAVRAWVSGLFQ